MSATGDDTPLLALENISKAFAVKGRGTWIRAVKAVSLDQRRGETIGVVGESGCGKTTLGRIALRLVDPDSGTLRFEGRDLLALDGRALRRARARMQMVFQDPFASLDARMRVSRLIEEPLIIHGRGDALTRRAAVRELLERVGLPPEAAGRYPHEFSGGQRQRICIARAIALEPRLVVADEPVSALDVSIQSQILNLLVELREAMGLAYLFISHDLAVIRHISDRVAVMYLGEIVESGPVDAVFEQPAHPYTQALLSAIPRPVPGRRRDRVVLPGDVPSPEAPPPGCPFHPRCPRAMDRCRDEVPVETTRGTGEAVHRVRCHLYA